MSETKFYGSLPQAVVYTPSLPRLSFYDGEIDITNKKKGDIIATREFLITTRYPRDGESWRWQLFNTHPDAPGNFAQSAGEFWYHENPAYTWFKLKITINNNVFQSPTDYIKVPITNTAIEYKFNVTVSIVMDRPNESAPSFPPEDLTKLTLRTVNEGNASEHAATSLVLAIPQPKVVMPLNPTGIEIVEMDGNIVGATWEHPRDSDVYIYALAENDAYISAPANASSGALQFTVAPAAGEKIRLRAIKGNDQFDSDPITVPGGGEGPGNGLKPTGVTLASDLSAATWESPTAGGVYIYAYADSAPISAPTSANAKRVVFTTKPRPGQTFWLVGVKDADQERSDEITVPGDDNPGDNGPGGYEYAQPKNLVATYPAPGHITFKWSEPVPDRYSVATSVKNADNNTDLGATYDYDKKEMRASAYPGTRVRLYVSLRNPNGQNLVGWSKVYTI